MTTPSDAPACSSFCHPAEKCCITEDGECDAATASKCPDAYSSVLFRDLYEGDRFIFGGYLYTLINGDCARRHTPESIALQDRGHGYRDSICTFRPRDKVEFCPPSAYLWRRRAHCHETMNTNTSVGCYDLSGWVRTADRLPCEAGEQANILMWSPGWATWLKGMATRWRDGSCEWAIYNQQQDRYHQWEHQPEFWMAPILPNA